MGQLEREFEEYKALHKFAILKAKMIKYYTDLQIIQGKYYGDPEALADRELRCLVLRNDNLNKFNHLYNLAYAELAEVLE